jgi:hypothetical protein
LYNFPQLWASYEKLDPFLPKGELQMAKKKWWRNWYWWFSAFCLLLCIGVLLVFHYDLNQHFSSLTDIFQGHNAESSEGNKGNNGNEEIMVEDKLEQRLIFQKMFRFCSHYQITDEEDWPEELHFLKGQGPFYSLAKVEAELPEGWQIVNFSDELVIFTFLDDICSDCSQKKYLGIYDGKIAIYTGEPSQGTLEEVLIYEVKDVYRKELETGIPFETEEEKQMLLENYTT